MSGRNNWIELTGNHSELRRDFSLECSKEEERMGIEAHYVYMVRCANGTLYTGYTKDLGGRIAAHNLGKGGRYTRAHRPVELIRCWSFTTKREALQIEYRIKQLSRQRKLELIQQPDFPCSEDWKNWLQRHNNQLSDRS